MKMDIGEFKLEYGDAAKYYINLFIDVVREMPLSDSVVDGEDSYLLRLANRGNLELFNRYIFVKYSSGEVIIHNMFEIYFDNKNTGYGIFFKKVVDNFITVYDYEIIDQIHPGYEISEQIRSNDKKDIEGLVIFNESRKD